MKYRIFEDELNVTSCNRLGGVILARGWQLCRRALLTPSGAPGATIWSHTPGGVLCLTACALAISPKADMILPAYQNRAKEISWQDITAFSCTESTGACQDLEMVLPVPEGGKNADRIRQLFARMGAGVLDDFRLLAAQEWIRRFFHCDG